MMIIYLAVSADTTSGDSAYAYKIDVQQTVSRRQSNSTGPRELLRGLIAIFDDIIKHKLFKQTDGFTIISNNQFITKMINERQINSWHDNNWIKSNGEITSSVDFLKEIYNYLKYFDERNIPIFITKPVSSSEDSQFKGISRIALNTRKFS